MAKFKVKDRAISKSKWSDGLEVEVHKISEIGVHVKFWDEPHKRFMYEIFRFEPTHRLHSNINDLLPLTSTSDKLTLK